MNRDEVKKLIIAIKATYPMWKLPDSESDLSSLIDAWSSQLLDDDPKVIALALKAFNRQNITGYPPSIGQLLNEARKITDTSIDEGDAWGMVLKAIKNSTYNAKEEFDLLPQAVKRVVGSYLWLKEMAMTERLNLEVESSNFKRAYKAVLEDDRRKSLYSQDIKALSIKECERLVQT